MHPLQVIEFLKEILEEQPSELTEESTLIGGNTSIDSMSLVQLCLKLEESAIDNGFVFDWTSEKAMSSMNSVFRTPRSISDEFNSQMNRAKLSS